MKRTYKYFKPFLKAIDKLAIDIECPIIANIDIDNSVITVEDDTDCLDKIIFLEYHMVNMTYQEAVNRLYGHINVRWFMNIDHLD